MHKSILIAAMAGALTSCSNSEAQGRAQFIAAGVDAITPKSLGDGLVMTAARAEKTTLILSFEGVASDEMALPDFDRQARAAACQDKGFRDVTAKGVDLRLDFVADNGSDAQVMVESC